MRRPTVAVVGDGHLEPGDEKGAIARELGGVLVERGWRIVCGGMRGVMEQVCLGARDAPDWFDGATVGIIPSMDPRDANPYVDVVVCTGMGHARNALVAQADAVIALGGGAGTLSEVAMAWVAGRLILGIQVPGWSGELAGRPIDARVRFEELGVDDRVWPARDARHAVRELERLWPYYAAAGGVTTR